MTEAAKVIFRNRKDGRTYELIGSGNLHEERWFHRIPIAGGSLVPCRDRKVVICRDIENGSLHACPMEKFEGGEYDVMEDPWSARANRPVAWRWWSAYRKTYILARSPSECGPHPEPLYAMQPKPDITAEMILAAQHVANECMLNWLDRIKDTDREIKVDDWREVSLHLASGILQDAMYRWSSGTAIVSEGKTHDDHDQAA